MNSPRHSPTAACARSAAVAGWFTGHTLAACALLAVALGDFVNGDQATGDFRVASLAQVLAHYEIPLQPALFFALLFAALAGAFCAAAWLWQRALRTLGLESLDALTSAGLKWSLRQQFLSGWLLLVIGLTSAAELSLHLGGAPLVFRLVGFSWLILPVLVWRPRWLHAAKPDRHWLPSWAAMAVYVGGAAIWTILSSAVNLLGITWGELWVLLLGMVLMALQASVLIYVGSRSEIVPHLASRWRGRFWQMGLLALIRPVRALAQWVLSPVLLIAFYSILVEPAVAHLSPSLPVWGVTLHKGLMLAVGWWGDHGWLVTSFMWVTWGTLYLGRCMVLFDQSADRS